MVTPPGELENLPVFQTHSNKPLNWSQEHARGPSRPLRELNLILRELPILNELATQLTNVCDTSIPFM
jgi:hypothetical protein